MNKSASDLAHQRWRNTPKNQRSQGVGRNGGRKRIYPKCERYRSTYHRFVNDKCLCGFVRNCLTCGASDPKNRKLVPDTSCHKYGGPTLYDPCTDQFHR